MVFAYALSALCRSGVSYAAGVDDCYLRRIAGIDLAEAELLEKFSKLLAFVLIDFAAECCNGKGFHVLYNRAFRGKKTSSFMERLRTRKAEAQEYINNVNRDIGILLSLCSGLSIGV